MEDSTYHQEDPYASSPALIDSELVAVKNNSGDDKRLKIEIQKIDGQE
jgi:hypothetical protein